MLDITFAMIGGLDPVITSIIQEVVWPILHSDVRNKLGFNDPFGCLLAGPRGTGKTMLARAALNRIAEECKQMGDSDYSRHLFFLRGQELAYKTVNEIEIVFRDVYEAVRADVSDSKSGLSAVMVVDDIDELFPSSVHPSAFSSPVHASQFNALVEALLKLGTLIIVGTANHADDVDMSAVYHGRITRQIIVPRPDPERSKEIFFNYLLPGQTNPRYDVDIYEPINRMNLKKYNLDGSQITHVFNKDPHKIIHYLISNTVNRIFDPTYNHNNFLSVYYEGRSNPTIFRYADFICGAQIARIMTIAKKLAAYDHIKNAEPLGLQQINLYAALEQEYAQIRVPSNLEDIKIWLRNEWKEHINVTKIEVIKHPDPDSRPRMDFF